jgi:hypothetical protein
MKFLLVAFAFGVCFSATLNPKLRNLPDNTWMILDSAGIQLSGHFAYSGGAYDRTNHKFLVFGGGHWDGWQNNVLCFDIAADTWNSMYTPDPSSDYTCSNVNTAIPGMLLNRGRPASRHTYDMIEFMDHIGKMVMWSGPTYSSLWSCPGNTMPADTWLYDWATNTWEYKNASRTAQPSGEAMCGVYNPVNHLYYAFNNTDFYTYNAATDAWTKLPTSTGTKPGGYDHSMVGNRAGTKYYLFDGQMRVYTVQTNSWSGTSGAPSATNDNPSYDENWNDVLCLGSSATKIHVFHTATLTWEVLTPSGPVPAMDDICYGRFFYDPVDSVHLYMAQVNYRARTYAYRYKRGAPSAAETGKDRPPRAALSGKSLRGPDAIYDMSGRRIGAPSKSGIYLYRVQGRIEKRAVLR